MAKKIFKNPVISFIKEAIVELKKVVWPKKAEVVKKTIIVVVSIVFIGAIIAALDYGLSKGIEYLIGLK